MVILGIDPGLAATGFGAISIEGGLPGLIKCGQIKTPAGRHVSGRLNQIHSDLTLLMTTVRPDLVAVENVFSLVRYPKAGILLGGVLAAVYISAFQNGQIPTVEISPKEVKSSLSGYGGAGKEQVKAAVRKLLKVSAIKSSHASDALAVALAAFYRGPKR